MPRRLIPILLAFIVALAAVLPVSVRAMPMPADLSAMGMQRCPICPQPARTGANPDKMPGCQILACAGTIATPPTPVLLLERALLPAPYLLVPPVCWTAATRAPDPFPPKPITLV